MTIGIAVNGLLFPPVYSGRAQETTRRLASDMASLLTEMAESFRRGEPPERTDRWRLRAGDAVTLTHQAEQAIELSREGNRMNVRRPQFVLRTPTDSWQNVLVNLRGSWPYLAEMAEAARTMIERVRPFEYPDPVSRETFATVLERMAAVVRLLGDGQFSGAEFDAAVDAAREAVDEMTDRVETASASASGTTAGLAGVLLPARHALHELAAS